jgi:hypothetical protein
MKDNYEYLLEQMGEIESNSKVDPELSGTHKKEKWHLFHEEKMRYER